MTEIDDATESQLRALLADVLALPAARAAGLETDTPLFGAMPELDSIAVASLLTAIEDRFDIAIEDDEVDADLLSTFGNLLAFVRRKAGL